ncbi:uncharacterized protein [Panulirus ornatus]|uniref:uncharacterized protein n=1 Tax=Panulirus ornatus TaxID=150431 RepID=UPI003A872C59
MRGRRYLDIFLLVLTATLAAVYGDSSHAHHLASPSDTHTSEDVLPDGSKADRDSERLRKTAGRSSRVFVNTSIPFSVAPQPVKYTPEVSLARKHFMLVFEKIREAVVAADHDHFNVTSIGSSVENDLHHHHHHHHHHRYSHHRHDDSLQLTTPEPQINIYPDPVMEPDYFLPSVHVDPLLMEQLYPPLPPNPFVQEMRPLGEDDEGGMCYEFIILEPESENFHEDDNGSPESSSEASHSQSVEDPTPSDSEVPPVLSDTSASKPKSTAPVNKSSRAHVHQAQDVHDTDSSSTKTVPPHFRVPVLSFLSRVEGDVPKLHQER